MKKIAIALAITLVVAVAAIFLKMNTVSNGNSYLPADEVVANLRKTAAVEKNGATCLGRARKKIMDGNIFLYLDGSPYEMGFQHGRLLAEEISRGVVPEFANPLDSVPTYRDKTRIVKWFVMKYLEFKVYAPLERNTPPAYLQELKGIADGSGLDFRTVFIANFLSDMKMVMFKGDITGKFTIARGVVSCSDFAAANKATRDGKMIIGRNTDYTGQGRWMKNQTVFVYGPKNGLSYAHISTAGIIKCNAGMNEKGITVGGHFMGFDDAAAGGISFAILENEIMRKASSIDEAISILRNAKIAGSWGLFICDGKTRTAVAVEANSRMVTVRAMKDDVLYLTNYAITEKMAKHDFFRRKNLFMRDIAGRYRDLGILIQRNYGRITPEMAAEFMGNHFDFVVNAERSCGNSVGAISTITSVVFAPEQRIFWLASGSEPAWNNAYAGYDFKRIIHGDFTNDRPGTLPGYRWRNARNRAAMEDYTRALVLYHGDVRDTRQVVSLLESAIDQAPDEPVYSHQLARMLIHDKSYRRAEKVLLKALTFPQWNNEKAISWLLLGNLHDLSGKRGEALSCYKKILSLYHENGGDFIKGINRLLYSRALDYSKRPFTENRMKDMEIDFRMNGGVE